MIVGYGISENLGTLINFTFLFFSSIWMYSGTSLSLFTIAPEITVSSFDFSLTSIVSFSVSK